MTRYQWHPDNLRLAERRLRRIELIAFGIITIAIVAGAALGLTGVMP